MWVVLVVWLSISLSLSLYCLYSKRYPSIHPAADYLGLSSTSKLCVSNNTKQTKPQRRPPNENVTANKTLIVQSSTFRCDLEAAAGYVINEDYHIFCGCISRGRLEMEKVGKSV